MGFSNIYFQKALQYINQHREQVQLQAQKEKQAIYAAHPELARLEHAIADKAVQATRAMLSGGEVRQAIQQLSTESQQLQDQRNAYLLQNQIDQKKLHPVYWCDKCADTGYDQGKLCSCVKKMAIGFAIEQLNAATPLEHSRFDNFSLDRYPKRSEQSGVSPQEIMSKIYQYCKDYAEHFTEHAESLLFFGDTGLGKTHLSLAIARVVLQKGYSVIYGPVNHLLGQIEHEHFSKEKNGTSLQTMLDCDLLILDDLGAEFTTPFTVSTLYDLINSRILNNKPTIINTNLTVQELEQQYAPRIVSRICGCYKCFKFLGVDLRLKK